MNTDSIARRFVAAIMATVICMCIMVWSQVYFEKKLVGLHQEKIALLELSNQLLEIRRHEKDFLMRKEPQYLAKINERAARFTKQLALLAPLVQEHQLAPTLLDDSIATFTTYKRTLDIVATKIEEIGFSEQDGEQRIFRSAIHELERNLEALNEPSLQVIMLQIRRAEKDFMLRKRMEYVSKVSAQASTLEVALKKMNQQESLLLLNRYVNSFMVLVESYQQLGFTHEDGLRRVFRTASHRLEDTIKGIDEKLTPLIDKKEENVKVSRAVIITINLGLLLLLMVSSFRSINTALKSFTAFFHQSKTDMTALDITQFQLREFKAMAEMANDMIDARKLAEQKLQQAMKELADANDNLAELASLDALTGLPNRRAMDKQLDVEWHRALRNNHLLAILLIDVDYFKAYNDHYGHAKGDDVLIYLGNRLREITARSGDFIARYGGEEFLAILPNTDGKGAIHFAEKLVEAIEKDGIPHEANPNGEVLTVSVGVYSGKPEKHLSVNSWISQADSALYRSKDLGRNCATLAEAS